MNKQFPQDIILRPIISEESMDNVAEKKYTFAVAKGANKIEIAKAVEALFKVEVRKVNTISMPGKPRTYGRFKGLTSAWKKAIVTLTEDSKTIEVFDGLY